MLRWARMSDLMLGGAFDVLGADYFDKVTACANKTPATVSGTVQYEWTDDDPCGVHDDSDDGCGTDHKRQTGTVNINFNKRNPNFCCDWDDAGGNYNADLLQETAYVNEVSGPGDNICDVTHHAEASHSQSTGPGSTVSLDFTFSPDEADHDAFVYFSDFVENDESDLDRSFNCDEDYSYEIPYTQNAVFFSNDCPFREPGVPREPGLMGTYDPDAKTIDMSCTDDQTTPDGVHHHIEVTGTLTVTGGL